MTPRSGLEAPVSGASLDPPSEPTVPPRRAPIDTTGDRTPRLVAGAVIVVLSAIGWIMLVAGGSEADALDQIGSSGSSVGAFLQPAGGTTLPRIRYERAGESITITNGGSVALSNDLELAVTVSPYPPTTFDLDVDLRLVDATGAPVDDASIHADWDMAVMFHGPFFTAFDARGDGRYTAHFDVFMYGPWELITHVSSPSHRTPDELPISIYVWPE